MGLVERFFACLNDDAFSVSVPLGTTLEQIKDYLDAMCGPDVWKRGNVMMWIGDKGGLSVRTTDETVAELLQMEFAA